VAPCRRHCARRRVGTNVIGSRYCNLSARPAAVFLLVAGGVVQLCISGNVYAEYEEAAHAACSDYLVIGNLRTFIFVG